MIANRLKSLSFVNRDACSASFSFVLAFEHSEEIFGLNSGHTHTTEYHLVCLVISDKVAFESNYSVNIVSTSR